jgi:hypothetical protein
MFTLIYVQPKPADHSPDVPIFERKEHRLEAQSREAADPEIATFLAKGAVICGTTVHSRRFLAVEEHHVAAQVPQSSLYIPTAESG